MREVTKLGVAAAVVAALLGGCSTTTTNSPTSASSASSVPPSSSLSEPDAQRVQIYSAVIDQLAHVDHTFGRSVSDPFGRVFVLDGVASRTSDFRLEVDGERFSEEARREIIEAVDDDPPLEFVSSRDQVPESERPGRTDVVDDGAIIGLGEIGYNDDDTATVGAVMWCGGLCGLATTYVLEKIDDRWSVVGTEGPVSIS